MEKREESPRARANRRATGVIVAVFLVVSAAFIVDSTWELAKGAFDLGTHEVLSDSPAAVACYDEVKRLQAEVDNAVVESAKVKIEDSQATFQRVLGDRFSDEKLHVVEASCRDVPRGLAAYGALLRIRRAEEAQLIQRAAEVGPSRGDLLRALSK